MMPCPVGRQIAKLLRRLGQVLVEQGAAAKANYPCRDAGHGYEARLVAAWRWRWGVGGEWQGELFGVAWLHWFTRLNSTTHTQWFAAHEPEPLIDSHKY